MPRPARTTSPVAAAAAAAAAWRHRGACADHREENLEVKARKRLAREQKAQYKALGIDPPPKLNVGRKRGKMAYGVTRT
jgi:hypothetical protein